MYTHVSTARIRGYHRTHTIGRFARGQFFTSCHNQTFHFANRIAIQRKKTRKKHSTDVGHTSIVYMMLFTIFVFKFPLENSKNTSYEGNVESLLYNSAE